MNELGNESYYITEKEFYLLLAGKGIKHWYGLLDNQKLLMQMDSKEDMYQILASLYQKEYVEWKNDIVKIMEPMASIMDALQKAHYCMVARKYEKTEKNMSYYFTSKNGILIEKSLRDDAAFRLTNLSKQELMNHIWEMFALPLENLMIEKDDSMTIESEEEMQKKVSFTLINVHSGIQIEAFSIMEAGLFNYILYECGREKDLFFYEKEWCSNRFNTWMIRDAIENRQLV